MESDEKKEGQDGKKIGEEKSNTKDSSLKHVLGQEVTWAAVAAIGGAVIVIWNIIRYIFTFCSSLGLYFTTKVPLYLLMIRNNKSFTDFYLLYATMLVLIIIGSFTELNPVSEETATALLKVSAIMSSIVCVLIAILTIWVFLNGGSNKYIPFVMIKFITAYMNPGAYAIGTIGLGQRYIRTRSRHSLLSTLLGKNRRDVLKSLRNDFTYPEEHLAELEKDQKSMIQRKSSLKRRYPINLCLVVFMCLFGASLTVYGLIDQDNRFIVADLGEQYIVQDAIIDENNTIYLKTDGYSIIDSSGEKIKRYSYIITNKQPK